ncbi:MAG: gfo/Idh/MocA family oxidoreductase [Bacteroidetes bacterium]|nr:MAG: gfo/Idh/MocA family oxidoreductase [Bacteroidota bacterium]
MREFSFAIIGVGHIGRRHAEILSRHPQCRLLAVCDVRPAEELNIAQLKVPLYESPEQMLQQHPDAEVVCVATPNGLHTQHALAALEAGRHVIIEKPMALRRADGEKVLHKALQTDRQVFCVMQNRYSPPAQWLKQLLDARRLGRIFVVQANCYWNRNDAYYAQSPWRGTLELDGGPLFTQFSHFIDLLYWLFGDITNIQATFGNFRHQHNTQFEDSGLVQFQFVDGGLGSLSYSTANWQQNFESSLTIIGEKGTVKLGGQYMQSVQHCHIQDYHMPQLPPSQPPNDYGPYQGSAANHHFVFENVIQTLQGRSSITTNALEGIRVVDIIERIYALR